MNDTDTPETEVQPGLTEDEAVGQLLEKWNKAEEARKPAPKTKEQTEDKPEAEEPEPEQSKDDAKAEEEPEEDESTGGEVEIDVAGEKFSVPKAFEETAKRIQAKAKEVEAGATRKFQDAADLRKSAENQIEIANQLQQIAEANAELLGDHTMVSRRLRQLESINIAETDSETLTRLNAEYNQLTAAQKRIADTYQRNIAAQKDQQGKVLTEKRAAAEKHLASKIKGWGPDYAQRLAKYAAEKGMPADAIAGITEAWMVEVLDDAAYGKQMRESKPQTEKRVAEAAKTLRPGSAGSSKSANVAKVEQALAKAKRTGTIEDAAMAWLARSAQRKR